MKKYSITFIALIILIASCQKDDFCIDPVTPQLVIRFYDNEYPDEFKKTTDLYVWASGKEEFVEGYDGVKTDSIAIPLDPADNFTLYYLEDDGILDSITINYIRKEIFVSRSCGYKYIFENLTLTNVSDDWILDTEITNETVENETEHIKIWH